MKNCKNCGVKTESDQIVSGLCSCCLSEYNNLKDIVEGNTEKKKDVLVINKESSGTLI